MEDRVIKNIYYQTQDGGSGYLVGRDGVTKINRTWHNNGYQYGCWQVWKGDKLIAEMYMVTEVIYE